MTDITPRVLEAFLESLIPCPRLTHSTTSDIAGKGPEFIAWAEHHYSVFVGGKGPCIKIKLRMHQTFSPERNQGTFYATWKVGKSKIDCQSVVVKAFDKTAELTVRMSLMMGFGHIQVMLNKLMAELSAQILGGSFVEHSQQPEGEEDET